MAAQLGHGPKPYDIQKLPWTPLPTSGPSLKISIVAHNNLRCRRQMLVEAKDLEQMITIPCFSFLLEREHGDGYLFDFSASATPETLSPGMQKQLRKGFEFVGEKIGPIDYLKRNGYDLSNLKALILSHQHWDHFGNLDTLPFGIPVILGPTTKASLGAGYPKDPESKWFTRWVESPNLLELPSVEIEGVWKDEDGEDVKALKKIGEDTKGDGSGYGNDWKWEKVGSFEKAVDWFGDGSLYLADAPGHCQGHMCAIVRTTSNPDTYMILAGDSCHHASCYAPPPLSPSTDTRTPIPLFPWSGPSQPPTSMDLDPELATETIGRVTRMHQEENCCVLLAHEEGVDEILPVYPERLNGWREKGWKEEKEQGFKRRLKETGYA